MWSAKTQCEFLISPEGPSEHQWNWSLLLQKHKSHHWSHRRSWNSKVCDSSWAACSTSARDFTHNPKLRVQHPEESTAQRFRKHSSSDDAAELKLKWLQGLNNAIDFLPFQQHPCNSHGQDKSTTVSPSEMEEGAPASLAEQSYNDLFDYWSTWLNYCGLFQEEAAKYIFSF